MQNAYKVVQLISDKRTTSGRKKKQILHVLTTAADPFCYFLPNHDSSCCCLYFFLLCRQSNCCCTTISYHHHHCHHHHCHHLHLYCNSDKKPELLQQANTWGFKFLFLSSFFFNSKDNPLLVCLFVSTRFVFKFENKKFSPRRHANCRFFFMAEIVKRNKYRNCSWNWTLSSFWNVGIFRRKNKPWK